MNQPLWQQIELAEFARSTSGKKQVKRTCEQSVRGNILQGLLPLQSVVRAGNDENSRVTGRMSDSIDHFFQTIKSLV